MSGGIIPSTTILAKCSVLLLVGVFVPCIAGYGCVFVSTEMVGVVDYEEDVHVLSMVTTTVLDSVRGTNAMEECAEISEDFISMSIHEPPTNKMSGEYI